MTAVNLIPHESRASRFSIATSPQTLALFAGLVAILVAAILYVSAANNVAQHNSQLAKLTASAAAWKTVASAFVPYVGASQQRAQQLAAVRQLAAARFPWPGVLDQIAELLPSDAALSSLSASPTASATAGSASAAASASASALPSFSLSGCAASQSAVAKTIEQLRGVDGGSTVTLSSSTGPATGSATSSSGSTSGGCAYPVTFQMTMTLTGSSSGAASRSGATTSATAGTSTSTTTGVTTQ